MSKTNRIKSSICLFGLGIALDGAVLYKLVERSINQGWILADSLGIMVAACGIYFFIGMILAQIISTQDNKGQRPDHLVLPRYGV